MRLLLLAEVCRKAGLTVVENPGWQSRGAEFPARPKVLVAHHTATAASAGGDLPTLRVLVNGHSTLPGPLCQVGLSRSGVVHIIASGKANHAGTGAWQGVTSSSSTIGIEAEHPGGSAPWPTDQLVAYDRLCAALLRHLGQGAHMLCGHKEWALPKGRKVDPNYDMAAQRARVGRLLAPTPAPTPATPTSRKDSSMVMFWHKGVVYLLVGGRRFVHGLPPAVIDGYRADGVPLVRDTFLSALYMDVAAFPTFGA